MSKASKGDTVRINYTGRLADGTEFDSSKGREPLQFTLGAGQVIPGLEAHVEGMEAGERSTVTIPPEAAYGPHRAEAVQTLDRTTVPAGIDLKVGTQLNARTSTGTLLPITVVDFDDSQVRVDTNHPLAGKELVFDVEVVDVQKAA